MASRLQILQTVLGRSQLRGRGMCAMQMIRMGNFVLIGSLKQAENEALAAQDSAIRSICTRQQFFWSTAVAYPKACRLAKPRRQKKHLKMWLHPSFQTWAQDRVFQQSHFSKVEPVRESGNAAKPAALRPHFHLQLRFQFFMWSIFQYTWGRFARHLHRCQGILHYVHQPRCNHRHRLPHLPRL